MTKWWMVRAGDHNELIDSFLNLGIASIGWTELKNPQKYLSKEELLRQADKVYYDSKTGSRKSWVNQVWRFSREIEVGDKIISYNKEKREYIVGKVTSPHFYNLELASEYYPNHVKVQWETKTVTRDALSQSAKYSLGSVLTVFRLDDWGNEIESVLNGTVSHDNTKDLNNEHDEEPVFVEDFEVRAQALVEDQVDKLDPWELQELVGGLLRAMNYTVRVSPPGPDGGVDIHASKDAFGFEKPIIKVQVKHRKSASGSPEIQQLLGANPLGASCLFVSTGGFTKSAISIAAQNGVKLVDLQGLVELIFEWYEKMPNDTRALLPLKRMYIPGEI